MKVVLHFGMPKTGTTSIQRSLHQCLTDDRFHYLSISGANQSEALSIIFQSGGAAVESKGRLGYTVNEMLVRRERLLERLDDQLARQSGKTVILSAEILTNFKEHELFGLIQHLSKYTAAISGIAYVRSPKSFMETIFQERLKRSVKPLSIEPDGVRSLYPDYQNKLEKFDRLMGSQQVQLVAYRPEQFVKHDVVVDFCERLGLEMDGAASMRTNDSLSLPAVKLLFAYRSHIQEYQYQSVKHARRVNRVIIDTLADLAGPKFRLHSTLVQPVLRARKSDTQWMENRLGTSLAEHLEHDDELAIRLPSQLNHFSEQSIAWLMARNGQIVQSVNPDDYPAHRVGELVHAMGIRLVPHE